MVEMTEEMKVKLEIYGEENVGVSVSQNINNDPSDTDKMQ